MQWVLSGGQAKFGGVQLLPSFLQSSHQFLQLFKQINRNPSLNWMKTYQYTCTYGSALQNKKCWFNHKILTYKLLVQTILYYFICLETICFSGSVGMIKWRKVTDRQTTRSRWNYSGSKISWMISWLKLVLEKKCSSFLHLLYLTVKCGTTLKAGEKNAQHHNYISSLCTHMPSGHSGWCDQPECLTDRMWPQGVVILRQEVSNCLTTSTLQ